jgi:hypothetical protein
MPIEILAGAALSSFIAPLAKQGLEALAGRVGEALGDDAAHVWREKAGNVWRRVREKFGGATERKVLEALEAAPDDGTARTRFEVLLQTKLDDDEQLAAELEEVASTLRDAETKLDSGMAIQHSGTGDVNALDAREADLRNAKNPKLAGKMTIYGKGDEPPPRP